MDYMIKENLLNILKAVQFSLPKRENPRIAMQDGQSKR
jgi:hypothetical protein